MRKNFNRRTFCKQTLIAGTLTSGPLTDTELSSLDDEKDLLHIQQLPVLRRDYFPEPVILDSVELLRNGKYYIARARSVDGAEGYAVGNEAHLNILWPVFLKKVAPFFIGKDARNLDRLVEDCFVAGSTYKYQSLAIWLPIATAEFAILDLLGQISGKPVGALIGEVSRSSIDVYRANNHRGRSAEESTERIVALHRSEGSNAVKIKLGGRMNLPEEPAGRSERLIPMVRKALGDDVTIYADANGSYDAEEGLRIGRLLEEINASFYEEPCPFDQLWETKAVSDGLKIPVAGGEQESSMRRFRWMIANRGVSIVQPDLHYFGGLIRSVKVARMAEAAGMLCTPHMSGAGLGSLYVLQFASAVPNVGPYQEYKGANEEIPFQSSVSLVAHEGNVNVPTGPGLGVELDPVWIKKSEILSIS